jgi:hypothetical protein
MDTRFDYVPNGAGWDLKLKRVISREHFRKQLRPLAIVPGYGMNAFIFGYHPNGASMERFLAEQGFEVWSLYLRGQEGTRRTGGETVFGMADLAIADLRACFRHIAETTETVGDGRVETGASRHSLPLRESPRRGFDSLRVHAGARGAGLSAAAPLSVGA